MTRNVTSDAQAANKITTVDELTAINEGGVVAYAAEENIQWEVSYIRVSNPDEHPHHSATVALDEVDGTRARKIKWSSEDGAEIVDYHGEEFFHVGGSLDELGVEVQSDRSEVDDEQTRDEQNSTEVVHSTDGVEQFSVGDEVLTTAHGDWDKRTREVVEIDEERGCVVLESVRGTIYDISPGVTSRHWEMPDAGKIRVKRVERAEDDDESELVADGGEGVGESDGQSRTDSETDCEKKTAGDVLDDIGLAFEDVEEFGRGNSPAVKGILRGIDAEPEVVLACDEDVGSDDPFVYISVFDAGYEESAAVVMEFLHVPDLVYVGATPDVYPALSELAENEYCWTVKDTGGIAETYIE